MNRTDAPDASTNLGGPRGPTMTRRAFYAGLTGAAALAAIPGGSSATGNSESPSALNSALDRHVASGSVPGLVALVAKGDKVHVHVAGMQSLETRAPKPRDTIFAGAPLCNTKIE